MRIAARPSTQDVARLAEAVEAAGEAEGVLLAALGSVGELRPPTMIMVIDADQLIIVNIEYTKPGTALDDHLRKEQTRALLDLLADYAKKRGKSGDAGLQRLPPANTEHSCWPALRQLS